MTALNVASLGKAHATILVVASIDELATHLIFFLDPETRTKMAGKLGASHTVVLVCLAQGVGTYI